MQDEVPDGWESPIYHALADPLLLGGVPFLVSIGIALGTIFTTVLGALLCGLWWQPLATGAGVYALAMVITAWEPQGWHILRAYLRHASHYEA